MSCPLQILICDYTSYKLNRYDGGFDGERRPLLDPTAEPPTNHKRSYTNKSPISEIISAPNSDAGNEENDELW